MEKKSQKDTPQEKKGKEAKIALEKLGELDTWIVGIQYYSGPLETDNEVFFQRNPANEFDSNAIEVYSAESQHVRGHIPRYDAEYFGGMMDSGAIFLKGIVGECVEPTRQAVRLDVYATSRMSDLLNENNADDPRALYHNFLLGVFRNMDKYSPATLNTFREWFRPIAHKCELFPETKLLYRIMKKKVRVLHDEYKMKEWQVFLDIVMKNPDFRGKLELVQKKY